MKIYQNILENILEKMPVVPPEKGGIIGGKNGVVTVWECDEGYAGSGCVYYPNVEHLNEVIASWIENGLDFMGIYHVHFGNARTLSKGDISYIERILRTMPDTVTQLSFPIIVQPDKEMVSYVAQIDFRGEVLIKKEEIEIYKEKII